MRTHHTIFAASAVLASLLAGPGRTDPPPARGWSPRSTPVVPVVRRVKDAVVNIHSERSVRAGGSEEFFALSPSQSRVNGMGTGIVIDPRGYIITNQHVVDDVSTLRVRLADGTTVNARILARDTENDLALIKISTAKPLPVMPLGTAKDLDVGEAVVAIGNAYGYDHTVTLGVVSALGRDVTLNREVRYKSLIQTDAAINPGNSGGPLVNMEGELVGVNVAIRAGAQGIGFAIPVDTMIKVASRMLAQEQARAGVAPHGLAARDDVTGASASRRVVIDRADGPAEKAGLRKGDVLVHIGTAKVASTLDIERAALGVSAGEKVKAVVRRDGVEKALELRLDALSEKDSRHAALPAPAGGLAWRKIGLRVESLASAAEVTRNNPSLKGGLLVGDVRPEGPAAKAGLRKGDILIGLHTWEMVAQDNVHYVLTHPDRANFNPLQFYILRGGQVHRGWLAVSE